MDAAGSSGSPLPHHTGKMAVTGAPQLLSRCHSPAAAGTLLLRNSSHLPHPARSRAGLCCGAVRPPTMGHIPAARLGLCSPKTLHPPEPLRFQPCLQEPWPRSPCRGCWDPGSERGCDRGGRVWVGRGGIRAPMASAALEPPAWPCLGVGAGWWASSEPPLLCSVGSLRGAGMSRAGCRAPGGLTGLVRGGVRCGGYCSRWVGGCRLVLCFPYV